MKKKQFDNHLKTLLKTNPMKKETTPAQDEKKLEKATIEDMGKGNWCIYDESGHLVEDSFDTEDQASSWASEHNYEVVELIQTTPPTQADNRELFTGGEWCVHSTGLLDHKFEIHQRTDEDGEYPIADIYGKTIAEAEANAALIAEAPAMYRALKELSKLVTMSDLAFSGQNVNAKIILNRINK